MNLELNPIGYIESPYREKFAIPRQPGLVTLATGQIHFTDAYADANYLRGIEQFSHLWLIFQFHATANKGHSPLVRPPRLGGNDKIGTFASRSTFRPNNLGLSVVKFEEVKVVKQKVSLIVSGIDLLDGTPILDIKPYLPYVDSIETAQAGYAQNKPSCEMSVSFSELAEQQLSVLGKPFSELKQFITQILAQDPRPAYRKESDNERVYGMKLYDFNVQWTIHNNQNFVLSIE